MKASLIFSLVLVLGLTVLPRPAVCDTERYLLIHGASSGAYRWYKIVTALVKRGNSATAVDLLALGRDQTPICDVTSIGVWASNAVAYLQSLPPGEKVIVVAHSAGGLVAQYLSENFPEKLKAVVYAAAVFPANGECALNILSPANRGLCGNMTFPACTSPLLPNSTIALFDPFCSDCDPVDNVLGQLLSRPQPLKVLLDIVKLTPQRFGFVRRFWVETLLDTVIPPQVQELTFSRNPPEKVFKLNTSHGVGVTKTRSFVRILEKVARMVA